MKNSKMKKFLVMMVAAVMTLGLLVPVSGAEADTQMEVILDEDFSAFSNGTWAAAGNFYADLGNAEVSDGKLSAKSSTESGRLAGYYPDTASYGSDKVVLSFDVQAKNVTGFAPVWIYTDTVCSGSNNGGGTEIIRFILNEGELGIGGWKNYAQTQIKDNNIVSVEMTFDMVAGTVSLRYKNPTDTDFMSYSEAVDFTTALPEGHSITRIELYHPAIDSTEKSYSIDNVKYSYDTGLVKSENETFTSVTNSYGKYGGWDIKTNLGAVENDKLVSKTTSNVVFANYWLKQETFGSEKIVISFDFAGNMTSSATIFQVYTGPASGEEVTADTVSNADANQFFLRLSGSSGQMDMTGWTNSISTHNFVDGETYNIEMTFNMQNATVTLRYKKASDKIYTSHSATYNLSNYVEGDVLKKLLFWGPVLLGEQSYSIDNFKVSYKPVVVPETKIEADLTVKDSGGNTISGITNIAAGKVLTITPKFTNVGSKDADSAVFIVAWYNKEGKLKKAVAKEVTTGLEADASYTEMEAITFTEATEEGDYIRAFAWNSLTNLQPYKMAE